MYGVPGRGRHQPPGGRADREPVAPRLPAVTENLRGDGQIKRLHHRQSKRDHSVHNQILEGQAACLRLPPSRRHDRTCPHRIAALRRQQRKAPRELPAHRTAPEPGHNGTADLKLPESCAVRHGRTNKSQTAESARPCITILRYVFTDGPSTFSQRAYRRHCARYRLTLWRPSVTTVGSTDCLWVELPGRPESRVTTCIGGGRTGQPERRLQRTALSAADAGVARLSRCARPVRR